MFQEPEHLAADLGGVAIDGRGPGRWLVFAEGFGTPEVLFGERLLIADAPAGGVVVKPQGHQEVGEQRQPGLVFDRDAMDAPRTRLGEVVLPSQRCPVVA